MKSINSEKLGQILEIHRIWLGSNIKKLKYKVNSPSQVISSRFLSFSVLTFMMFNFSGFAYAIDKTAYSTNFTNSTLGTAIKNASFDPTNIITLGALLGAGIRWARGVDIFPLSEEAPRVRCNFGGL
jgi:hypothetical protein